jgi:hypothetical protein
VLLLALVIAASFASVHSQAGVVAEDMAAYVRFAAAEPYLVEPEESGRAAVMAHCATLDRKCLGFARDHEELLLAAVPDNPEFWLAYDGVLEAGPLPVERLDLEGVHAYQGMIEATRAWLLREWLSNRLADGRRLHARLLLHLRRLGESNVLIDKMIFTATTGIILPAINVHMAHKGARWAETEPWLVDEMLHPLTPEALSLRHVLDGEARFASRARAGAPEDAARSFVDDLQRVRDFVAERSEVGQDEFWREGMAISEVAGGDSADVPGPSWAVYATSVRSLDGALHVLRALREIYEGRAGLHTPTVAAPFGWRWHWAEETQTLCLEAVGVHESVATRPPTRICLDYLPLSNELADFEATAGASGVRRGDPAARPQ